MFSRLGQVLAASSAAQKDRASGQVSLFDMTEVASAAPAPSLEGEGLEKWSLEQMLTHEKELLGFYVSGHPMNPYKILATEVDTFTGDDFRLLENGEAFRRTPLA